MSIEIREPAMYSCSSNDCEISPMDMGSNSGDLIFWVEEKGDWFCDECVEKNGWNAEITLESRLRVLVDVPNVGMREFSNGPYGPTLQHTVERDQ